MTVRSGHKQRLVFWGLIAVGLLVVSWLVRTNQRVLWDFRNNLWAPAHLLWQGNSPYQIQSLFPNSNAVWFPPVISFFFLLGALPKAPASMLWMVSNVLVLFVLIGLAAGKRPLPLRLAFALLASFLFFPTVTHLRLGQFSLMMTLCLLLAAHFLQAGSAAGAGLNLALVLAKPQLLILVLPGLFQGAWQRAGWRGAWRLALWSGAFVLLLLLPLFVRYPGWLPDFRLALHHNPSWLQPSLWQLLPRWWGWPGWLVAGLALLLALVANVLIWRRLPLTEAMAWSLALTPLVTPYVWSWDFVLLLPLFLQSLFRVRSKPALLALVVGYGLGWGTAVAVALTTDGSNHLYWWLSWQIAATIVVAHLLEQRNRKFHE